MRDLNVNAHRLVSVTPYLLVSILLLNVCVLAGSDLESNYSPNPTMPSFEFDAVKKPSIFPRPGIFLTSENSDINSILHCFSYLPPFLRPVKSSEKNARAMRCNPECFLCTFKLHIDESLSQKDLKMSNFQYFLTALRQNELYKNNPCLEVPLQKILLYLKRSCQGDIIKRIFQGQISYLSRCKFCSNVISSTSECFTELSLETSMFSKSIRKSIGNFLKSKDVSQTVVDHCQKCNHVMRSEIKIGIAPKVLILRIMKQCKYTHFLDLSDYSAQKASYNLFAAIASDKTALVYTSYVKTSDNIWYAIMQRDAKQITPQHVCFFISVANIY